MTLAFLFSSFKKLNIPHHFGLVKKKQFDWVGGLAVWNPLPFHITVLNSAIVYIFFMKQDIIWFFFSYKIIKRNVRWSLKWTLLNHSHLKISSLLLNQVKSSFKMGVFYNYLYDEGIHLMITLGGSAKVVDNWNFTDHSLFLDIFV